MGLRGLLMISRESSDVRESWNSEMGETDSLKKVVLPLAMLGEVFEL